MDVGGGYVNKFSSKFRIDWIGHASCFRHDIPLRIQNHHSFDTLVRRQSTDGLLQLLAHDDLRTVTAVIVFRTRNATSHSIVFIITIAVGMTVGYLTRANCGAVCQPGGVGECFSPRSAAAAVYYSSSLE